MWPWGHLAFGYILFTVYHRVRFSIPPSGFVVLSLVFGTQFPDIVDKPLAYWFHVIPEGRLFAHTLTFAVPLSIILFVIGIQTKNREYIQAFIFGWYSHILADSWKGLITLNFERLSFLLWPILEAPDYPSDSLTDHLNKLILNLQNVNIDSILSGRSGGFIYQLIFFFIVLAIWILEGYPGLKWIIQKINRQR